MHNPTHVRGTLRGVAVLGLLLSITALWSSPAFGHADEGEMKITKATATSPTTIEVEAGITFANDDDLAEEAVVTATVTDQAGTSVGPIPMPRRTGALYAATIELPNPGTWTIAVSSTEPTANATTQVDTTTAVSTSQASTTQTTSATSTTAGTAVASSTTTPEQTDNSTTTVVVAAIVVAAAIGVGAALVLRSRRNTP
ncbi:MAG: hypothetical protein KDB35_17795 [Acidimicrobiales bacterium]|nr:hypothetical protein [Acidimicrobiales bacterium]